MPASTDRQEVYSRSSLAKELGVSLKVLTQVMIDAGWLRHSGDPQAKDKWELTAKGEFEGGVYEENPKFGRYIVWPASITDHPVIVELSQLQLNTTAIAKQFGVSPKTMNRLLADLGWISPSSKGWIATEAGRVQGASQESYETTGIPYVIWSREVVDNPILQAHVYHYLADEKWLTPYSLNQLSEVSPSNNEINSRKPIYYQALNGLLVKVKVDLQIANFLHIYGIRYAYQKPFPNKLTHKSGDSIICDFYLSDAALCLLIERNDISPQELVNQLSIASELEKLMYKTVSLKEGELEQIEILLSKRLLPFGISLY